MEIQFQIKIKMNHEVKSSMKTSQIPQQSAGSSKKESLQKIPFLSNLKKQTQKYEYVWKGILMVVLVLASIIIKKVYIFQTHEYFKDIRMGSIWEITVFGSLFAIVFSIFDWLVHYIFDDLCDKYYINHQKYPTPEGRAKRCYTLVKWAYSIGYYLVASIWCYSILRHTSYFPTWLGGNGDPFVFVLNKNPLNEVTFQMKVFYILQFGKHFSRFFGHIFIRSEGNFFEFALHHGLSVFLIVFSYLTNNWFVGMTVLLLHDYSDFALILARLYRDYRNLSKKLLDAIYVHAIVFWVGCRIILFNYTCIFPALSASMKDFPNYQAFQHETMKFIYYSMAFMMIMLEVLHIFWTYYIAESFISVKVSTTGVRHSYD